MNPNSLANLRPPIQKGETRNPNGRPKTLKTVLSSSKIPKDIRQRVYEALNAALQCADEKQAAELLKMKGEELGQYGLVLKITAKGLLGKDGWSVMNDIFDRLFGKPKQQIDNTTEFVGKAPKIIFAVEGDDETRTE